MGVMLDGELVALGADGVSSFSALQRALKSGDGSGLVYYAFDLLHFDGWDLRGCRLLDRKACLEQTISWGGMLRYSGHQVGHAAEMLDNACRMRLEGLVCKQVDAPYRGGRSGAWRKLKCLGREEMVVLGFTPPRGTRAGLGALHLGYWDPAGGLHYAGAVGAGFSAAELTAFRAALETIRGDPGPVLASEEPIDRTISWVRPTLVVEVQYTAWSGAGRLRHAVFLGLREDKAPEEVVRDVADPGVARAVIRR